mgnify:CR=1 FL=1
MPQHPPNTLGTSERSRAWVFVASAPPKANSTIGRKLAWRDRFRGIFDAINARYPANDGVDIDALADMVSSVTEGGIVMAKALKEPGVLAEQIRLLRSYVKLL